MRPIDADALLYDLGLEAPEVVPARDDVKPMVSIVLTLTKYAIDAAPTLTLDDLRPKGRWVDHCVRDWRCSECGEKANKIRNVDGYCYDDKPNFCPNCGADMRGDGEDG